MPSQWQPRAAACNSAQRAAGGGDGGGGASGSRYHWTDKLAGGDAHDGLRHMDAAAELGCEEEEAVGALERVLAVLPALSEDKGRLAKLGVPRLATLCRDTPALVRRLIMLKELFPGADVGQLAVSHPFLLTEEEAQLREGLACLAELFPFAGEGGTPGVDRMAAAVPQLLDAAFARGALAQLAVLRYSASFDQTHVRANKVVPVEERAKEAYYDGE
eukprot:jgi/Tetstr1/442672/TSEL_030766.t1